jgi:hypothetical protein
MRSKSVLLLFAWMAPTLAFTGVSASADTPKVRKQLTASGPSARPAATDQRVSPGRQPLPNPLDQILANGHSGRRTVSRLVDGPRKWSKVDHDRDGLETIPHWSDSFDYHGFTYKYTMVGTDPKRGSATTTIPTVLIPLRFIFTNGFVSDASADVIDGRTSINGIINSPIFKNHDFTVNGISVGNTQYGDAFQRANFWDSVSGDYHVLLGQPTIASAFDVHVPDDLVAFVTDPDTGAPVPFIDQGFLEQAGKDAMQAAGVSPRELPIVVWGHVFGFGVAGFHGWFEVPGGVQTYIATGYHPADVEFGVDVYTLSHEVLEWINDPFGDNFTPGWDIPGSDYPHCESGFFSQDRLEVGDVVEVFFDSQVPVSTGAGTYHLTDGAFLDYFTRASKSRSAGGRYSFFGTAASPSAACAGHVEIDMATFEFPNATDTIARGINNQGWVVGGFTDASFKGHGFIFDGRNFFQLDYPGSIFTTASKINEFGQVVGSYQDAAGLLRGYSYFHGNFESIDFPGSVDRTAFAQGVNSRGDIVGEYDLTVPITHGFIRQDGHYRTVGTPFALQTEVYDINDAGLMVGDTYDDPFNGPVHGFLSDGISFTLFDFPAASDTSPLTVNNHGAHGGFFIDPIFGLDGYVTIHGYPFEVYADVDGMNDRRQIVGATFKLLDCDAQGFCEFRRVGYVATLPE